jgi:ParB-like chromosome segregation protein Spo0J
MSFTAELERLRKAAEGGSRTDRPDALTLEDVATCPAVFQPRLTGGADGLDAAHVEALAFALRNKAEDRRFLDPLTVFAVGRRFFVVDGHHRFAAYQLVGTARNIPVEHFSGTLDEAVREALRINAKVHLSMGREQRNAAAWRLVVQGERTVSQRPSKRGLADVSGLSVRTIARMRDMCRRLALMEKASEGDWTTGNIPPSVWDDYGQALSVLAAGRGRSDDDEEAWLSQWADRWADQLGRMFGKEAHKNPEVFGEALGRYLGEHNLGRALEPLGYFLVDPEDARRASPLETVTVCHPYGCPLARLGVPLAHLRNL